MRLALITIALSVHALAASAQGRQSPSPRPGVVTTQQKIAPAGNQTVFQGRVYGVAFGRSSDDVWVLTTAGGAHPATLYHLSMAQNRILASIPVNGSAGLQGLGYDAIADRPLVSHSLRLSAQPEKPEPTDGAPVRMITAVRLSAVDGDTLRPLSDRLGLNAVGSPAVARRASASGQRIAVVPLLFNDSLAVIDASTGALLRKAPTGIAPFAAAIDSAGTVAYVSNWGGRRPLAGEQSAPTGIAPHADRVVVDARGIAASGTVTRIDLISGRATHTIAVGLHPTAIVWDETHQRVFVADGNSDAVSAIDTRRNTVVRTMPINAFRERTSGLAPTALALSRDGQTLYVALGGINAIAVVNADDGTVKGLIPTAWYPASLALSADGKYLAVGALLGIGSGTASAELAARYPDDFVAGKGYVHAYQGAVNVVPVPGAAALAGFSRAVAASNRLTPVSSPANVALQPRSGVAPRAVPERPGEPSLVDHVVYIIKENRTYDQLFGDIARGNGDPTLAIYGDSITPNHHRLAQQFVLLDNFYATGGNSGDGHQWVTQANESDYAMWPGYEGRSYPFDGADPLAPAGGGFLWDAVLARGRTVTVFGEYAGTMPPAEQGKRLVHLEAYRQGSDFAGRFHIEAPNHRLNTILAHDFPSYGGTVPDVVRARIFLQHLAKWQQAGSMPDLVMIQLPSDHTAGTTPQFTTPAACLADNDLALGQIVEGLSRSPFWKSMAIFVVEDDAQGGVDHVDGHRTVALAISPFTRRGVLDHTMYAQQSMVKTIELMLGLQPLSVFDLIANDMRTSFIEPAQPADLTPYVAVEPAVSIYQQNPKSQSLRGAARSAALASARMNFVEPDAAPSDALNRILWHAAKGWNTPYPATGQSLFFPMSKDLADDEREDAKERGARADDDDRPAARRGASPDSARARARSGRGG